jgi:asparagine N-glycosylation enzyme membrane subunit Stt3
MLIPAWRDKKVILVIPAIFGLLIALILTWKYSWPLSWDIYYHVHLAKLYMENGLTLWDPLTYAPYGRPIFYPPFFHYFLAILSILFKTDPFQIARFLQPVFAFFIIFIFSYLGLKLYNLRVGLITGVFLFFTAVFLRAILPLPETLAIIIFPIALYLIYRSFQIKKYKYALLSGILVGIIALTHLLTAGILLGIILVYVAVLKIMHRKLAFKNLWIFLITMIFVLLLWFLPLFYQYGYIFQNPAPILVTPGSYVMMFLKILGVPTLIFGFLGMVCILKIKPFKWGDQDILILTWITFLLILSLSYFLGFKILIDRILNFAVFPLSILAAIGVDYLYKNLNRKLYLSIVAILLVSMVGMGFYYSNSIKPMVNDSERDVAEWFKNYGDKERVVMSLTEGIDPIIVSISRQPVSTGGYHPGMVKMLNRSLYYSGNFTASDVSNDDIGYFVEKSPIPHPPYFTLVYQNQDYKIWRVDR